MASIEIIEKGFYTTIQDRGRLGYGAVGIPESGAMDQQALRFSNLLLNNPIQAAALECTLIGPTMIFLKELAFVLTGAQSEAHLEGKAIAINQVYVARKNQVLRIGKVTKGCRVYLGLDGGVETEKILGSRSMFHPITTSAVVRSGAILETGVPRFGSAKGVHLQGRNREDEHKQSSIQVHQGPEYKLLSSTSKKKLLETPFTLSSGNRMGIVLNPIVETHSHKIVTGPVIPGTVQLTPSGRLFVLMRDCQTTGGYPRVLQLSEMAMNSLAQKITGDTIDFMLQ